MKDVAGLTPEAKAEHYRKLAEDLSARLGEAEETLDAIRSGEVDAVVIGGADGRPQIYTLQDADRPYRLLIEQMREGALTLSADGIVLFCNEAFAELLASRTETVVGRSLRPFFLDPARFDALFACEGKGEAALIAADGAIIPIQLSFAELPVYGEAGDRVFCAVVTNLTDERRQAATLADAREGLAAETARREGEAFSRLILESATDFAIIATDLEDRVTTWNEGAHKIFGWDEAEIVGRSAPMIWTPEDRLASVPELEMATATREGRAEDERWHVRRDGSRFWANGLLMPLLGGLGEHIGFLKILRDRSDSRAAEAALRQSEARLRFTLTAGRLGAWELDLQTGALTASETCRTNFGRDPDAAFSYDDLNASVFEDDCERMSATMERSILEKVDYDIEYRVRWPNGEIRWVQIRGRPEYAADGSPLRMTGVSLDITDRRRAAEELELLNQTLESRVAEEVAERGKAEEALRQAQKMEAVGQLTGGVAHDFNNLLTIIRSSVDFLRRDDLPDDRRRRYVDAIATTVDRAAKLTGQLLAFARRQALKPEVFDAVDQVRKIADMLQTIVGSRVQVVTELPDAPRRVEADVSQFETALVNLAVNARDAMDGEGVLTVRVATMSAKPARGSPTAPGADLVAISIADTGEGIEADKIHLIFEPFFTTKEVGKGTGLGLSQAYGFAKQSGGDLSVKSVYGHGATFTVALPWATAEASEISTVRDLPSSDQRGEGQWVLVVEDNAEVGSFSTQLLQDLGYNTVWAANADEALNILASDGGRFDLVFSDVVMPGISGVELGDIIRKRFPGLSVVLTSGYSEVLAEQGRHGFDLLQKPYAVEDLSRIIQSALRRKADADGSIRARNG